MKRTGYLLKLSKVLPLRLGLLTSLVLIVGLTGLTWHSAVAQQTEKVVTYGPPVKGTVDDSNVEDKWDFTAAGSDRLSITIERTDGTLVPRVELRTIDGKVLATAEKDITFSRAVITSTVLPAPGGYEIFVSRYKGKDGKTTGNYQMRVALLGAGVDYPGTTLIQGELKIGTDRNGTLANTRWQDSWAIKLDNTTPVTITVKRVKGTLVPTVALLDSSRKELIKSGPDELFTTAKITNYTVTDPGQYIIAIARVDGTAGATSGDYDLTIDPGTK